MKQQPYSSLGYSLIELMVAMAVGMILLTAIMTTMMDSVRTSHQISRSGEIVDTGRYLTSLIKEELSIAGFYGELDDYNTGATAQPNPCTVSVANLEAGMTFPLDGRDSVYVDSANYSCISAKSDTDVLVIRRASTSFVESTAGLSGSQHYLQATPTDHILAQGAGSFTLRQKDGATPARIHEFYQDIYYVMPGDRMYRRRLINNQLIDQPLAEGVVDFQVEYGIDRSGNGSPNADGANAAWVEAPSATEWDDVVAVRFYLLVRSYQTGLPRDTKTYSYADVQITPNSQYDYGLFSAAAQVTNVAIRRFVQ